MGAFVGLMCALTPPQPKSWPVHNQQQLSSLSIFPENIPGGCWGLMVPDEISKGSSNASVWTVKSTKEPHSKVEDGALQKGCCCSTCLQVSWLLPLTVFSGSFFFKVQVIRSGKCKKWGSSGVVFRFVGSYRLQCVNYPLFSQSKHYSICLAEALAWKGFNVLSRKDVSWPSLGSLWKRGAPLQRPRIGSSCFIVYISVHLMGCMS